MLVARDARHLGDCKGAEQPAAEARQPTVGQQRAGGAALRRWLGEEAELLGAQFDGREPQAEGGRLEGREGGREERLCAVCTRVEDEMRSLRAEEVSHLEEVKQQVRVVSGATVERAADGVGRRARQSVG